MPRPRTLVLTAVAALFTHGGTASAATSALDVTVSGAGAAVQITPPGTRGNCRGATCRYLFRTGTLVTLNATTQVAGVSLARWVGDCDGSTPTCTVPVNGRRAVIARFTPVQVFADELSGQGTVTPTPAGTPCGTNCWAYPYTTALRLTAAPADGWRFRRWYGGCASVTGTTCYFKRLLGHLDASAGFDCMGVCQVPQRVQQVVALTLNVSGPGYVTVNGRSCRGACTIRYWRGTMLVLRAYGKLTAWGGACAGTGSRCQVGAYKDLAGADPVINAAFS